MKHIKTLALSSVLLAGALFSCGNNNTVKAMIFTGTDMHGFTQRAIGAETEAIAAFGDRFSCVAEKNDGKDYLRVAFPVTGSFRSLKYSAVIPELPSYNTEINIEKVYKAIKTGNELRYATQTSGTNDKANSGEWFWACANVEYDPDNEKLESYKIVFSVEGVDKGGQVLKSGDRIIDLATIKNLDGCYFDDDWQQEEEHYALPREFDGGWQMQSGDVCGNVDIDAQSGFIYVATDDYCEDYYYIGGNYVFECYYGGTISMSGNENWIVLDLTNASEGLKNAFAPCGLSVGFER